MADQPRWPRGTPVAPSGQGPGGGRFRGSGGQPAGWAERLAAAAAARGGFKLMTHEQVASYLGRTDYHVVGTSGGYQSTVEFRRYSDGTRMAYKQTHETESKLLTPEYTARAEAQASLVGQAIGAPVPAAVLDPDNPRSVLMEYIESRNYPPQFIPGLGAATRVDAVRRARDTPEGRMLGLLDTLVGNTDRHHGNVIITPDGDAVGIDQGLALAFQFWGGPFEDMPGLEGMTSQFGQRLFRTRGELVEQSYYSPEAIAEARRRVDAIADRLDPRAWEGIRDALYELEAISTGTHDLEE